MIKSEKKAASSPDSKNLNERIDVFNIIILAIAFISPIIVLPYVVENVFNTPKNVVMLSGVLILIGIYTCRLFTGRPVFICINPTFYSFILLILLNLFSFIYTENMYFTLKAALLNITCLFVFYFVSMNIKNKMPLLLISISAFSGLLVALITWFQFFNHYLLIRWAEPDSMVMGTIGNSNFLGAYLIFPLFAMTCLIFLFNGWYRIFPAIFTVFILMAFLFSRARAGWFGFFISLPIFLFFVKKIYAFSLMGYLKQNTKKAASVFCIFILLIITLVLMMPDKFHNLMNVEKVTNPKTLMLRMNKYIPPSIWLIKESPLFGYGLWSYRSMVYKAQAEINRVNPGYFKNYPNPKPRRVHNEYLEILNDGGIVAAICLVFFLIIIMSHGYGVIRDENAPEMERIITSMCFSSIIAVMLASFFFFSFRLNTTMLMTVMMLGIMEGIYLRKNRIIKKVRFATTGHMSVLFFITLMVLAGILWFGGIRPLRAEMEHFRYKTSMARNDVKSAEIHILKAIELDPHNSEYLLSAAQFYFNLKRDFIKAGEYAERSIIDFNGDVTLYSAYYFKGLIKYRMGIILEAKEAFEKALYYNPTLEEAGEMLSKINEVLKKHDSVTIKLR